MNPIQRHREWIKNQIVELESKKIEHIQLLIELSFSELNVIERNTWDAYKSALKRKRKLYSKYVWEKYSQVTEAIEVKKGNEEEIWDFLT